MKRTITTFVAGLTLGLVIMSFVPKAQPNAGSMAIAAPVPAAMAAEPMNHCPNIHHAIEALEAAMNDMSKANHDFCGNKQDAMEKAGSALQSLRRAEDCDRCK
jgi:hypothetical protein